LRTINMQQNILKNGVLVVSVFALIFLTNEPALALSLSDQVTGQINAGAQSAGLGTPVAPQAAIASIIEIILSVLGVFFMGLVVYAGYLMFTARGDETKVEKSKTTLRGAIIGLIIILSAYGITRVVSRTILHSTVGNPDAPIEGSGIRANCQGFDCTLEGL